MDTMVAILQTGFIGQPVWLWCVFGAIVIALLGFDLGILHGTDRDIGVRESLLLSLLYIGVASLFGTFLWWQLGATPATEFFTGFVIEKSLSLDNVFVIAAIFGYLAIPRQYQHRVLFWGIVGVLILRALMVSLGTAVVSQADWILYVFGIFLAATGVKMLFMRERERDFDKNPLLRLLRRAMRITPTLQGNAFVVRRVDPATGKMATWVTPLLLALLLIEFADLIFAVDSVPAIFSITRDPFIVYTSNIFAVLGLRALFFALAAVAHRFAYLKYALALVLVFIGSKIFLVGIVGKIPASVSLSVTGALLLGGIAVSMFKTRTRRLSSSL